VQCDSPSTGVVIVDLDALARNYHRLRKAAAPAECGSVVKANAYGLGVGPVARRLSREGCRRFFVATLAEGTELRELLPEARIYVLEGALDGAETQLLEARLVPVLNSLEQVERWARPGREAVLHLDTGMSRLGMCAEEVDMLAAHPHRLENLKLEYVMTHLACADEPSHPLNSEQLRQFEALRAKLPRTRTSIANSAGVFIGPEHCGDLVRPGIGLYGGNPFIDRPNPMDPVVTLNAKVLQVRTVHDRLTVGYGATCELEPPARLATLGIGYADGYKRSLGNRGFAAVDGIRVPVVGRVSMDLVCVDISGVAAERVHPGRFLELIGPAVPLEEVAAAAGTVNYEILTSLGHRLRRVYEETG
jgi:alanine racemase